MRKKDRNTCPPTDKKPGQDISKTDTYVWDCKKKNVGTIIGSQSLAGTDVRIVEYLGKHYLPEIDVADGLDQGRGNFINLLNRNAALLDDYPRTIMVIVRDRPHKMRVLSFENTRRAIMMVDHNVKDPTRKEFLIQRKRQYFQILDDVYSGKLQRDVLLSSEDLDKIGTNYRSRANMNGLRMRIRRTRYKLHHPGRNLSVKDDVKLYEEDYLYVKGPGKLEPGWRKGCNDKEGRTLQAKQFFDMHEFMLDNLDDDSRRQNVLNHFKQYAPELITEHMPIQIETTRQSKLLGEG